MRYIWLIRHGKSAEGVAGMTDHERPLNARGQRDGQAMQAWYAQQNHPAEWLWVSSAARAQATAEFVAEAFKTPITTEPNLYLASPEALLDCLRATPDDITTAAIVAHNPGLTQLCNYLSVDAVTDNLVTFGSALFATEREWANLSFGNNHFLHLNSPKTI